MNNVILNVDTGVDDAYAIILLEKHGIRPDFIVASSGNSHIENAITNTAGVVKILNSSVPVYKGSSKPLVRDAYYEDYHGKNGMAGYNFNYAIDECENGILKMYEALKRKKYTIINTCPLTSIALLLLMDENIEKNINEIIIMGGAFHSNSYGNGNVGNAEFNIYYDPEAAKTVFNSNIKEYIMPLDVTMNPDFSVMNDDLKKMKDTGVIGDFMHKTLKYMVERYNSFEMHDPIATMAYFNKNAFKYINGDISVDSNGVTTLNENKNSNKYVACSMDKSEYIKSIYGKFFN